MEDAIGIDFRARPNEALCDETDNCDLFSIIDLPRPRRSHVEECRRIEAEADGSWRLPFDGPKQTQLNSTDAQETGLPQARLTYVSG